MCNKIQAIEILKTAYTDCIGIFGSVEEAYLYGSYARGDYTGESDVDILLTVDLENDEISKQRMAVASVSSRLSLEYGVTVSVTVKSKQQFQRYSSVLPFYQNVMREGIRYAG